MKQMLQIICSVKIEHVQDRGGYPEGTGEGQGGGVPLPGAPQGKIFKYMQLSSRIYQRVNLMITVMDSFDCIKNLKSRCLLRTEE